MTPRLSSPLTRNPARYPAIAPTTSQEMIPIEFGLLPFGWIARTDADACHRDSDGGTSIVSAVSRRAIPRYIPITGSARATTPARRRHAMFEPNRLQDAPYW